MDACAPACQTNRLSRRSVTVSIRPEQSSIPRGSEGEKRMENVLTQHIEATAGVLGGKPRIAGHRITVQNVVTWHDRLGMGADEIASEYDLTLADVYAALAYYFDHREEIDRSINDDEAFAEALRRKTPSLLRRKLRERATHGGAR